MAKPICVARIDKDTHQITGIYDSYAEAARHNDISRATIERAVRRGTLGGGYEWKRCRRKDE